MKYNKLLSLFPEKFEPTREEFNLLKLKDNIEDIYKSKDKIFGILKNQEIKEKEKKRKRK